ncbi:MAG: alpha/beta hydrolase [Gemmatimonadaceae bacterium]|nr:alpha/beta hydrolase [Gemmatimonadaceae bacterium]
MRISTTVVACHHRDNIGGVQSFDHVARGIAHVPLVRLLPFPSIVVASTNDPYISVEGAREYASAWGSRYHELPDAGHINAVAGFGAWHEGWALLQELRAEPHPDACLPRSLVSDEALDSGFH